MGKHSTPKTIEESPQSLAAARARGDAVKRSPHALVGARYDAARDCFTFRLKDETVLRVPRILIDVRRIAHARPAELRRIEIDELRTHVWFPDIGEGLNPVGFFARRLNAVLQAERGKTGGSARSAAKRRAAKANGKKGGRPRKIPR